MSGHKLIQTLTFNYRYITVKQLTKGSDSLYDAFAFSEENAEAYPSVVQSVCFEVSLPSHPKRARTDGNVSNIVFTSINDLFYIH